MATVEQPVRIGLHGANDLSYFHMESFLAGQLSEARRAELAGTLVRAGSQPGLAERASDASARSGAPWTARDGRAGKMVVSWSPLSGKRSSTS